MARLFAKVIGNPALMRELTRVGMQSRTLMEWVLRIMANLLRDDELGPAEAAYRAVAAIVRVVLSPAPLTRRCCAERVDALGSRHRRRASSADATSSRRRRGPREDPDAGRDEQRGTSTARR